jgi:hypothetical protein
MSGLDDYTDDDKRANHARHNPQSAKMGPSRQTGGKGRNKPHATLISRIG